ncbi:MAG TPA: tryptophan synthase subunit beta [Anaerohalosphaeraceae bacterium]|jgi:tryptophan synthase beta chain|nr:tryptophan synthase subunit beta [Anaerohalosphaeraceae bacterium]HRT51151.1 tryptophan synthase subunit beta [Anaerohalosphaeraceae bacterium]HRT87204.1 tryptophan synthase subunit beta [Anaerohalosphaeraceae bacterium]
MKHKGRFGPYGGFYVPEVLIPALEEIEAAFERCTSDPRFVAELDELYTHYAGRPTPLYFARRFSEHVGFKVYVKREDLLHGGAHKVNNTLGQGLLAKYMGKTRLIAETGAGQHGLATAMIGALFGMETKIFMGVTDVARQNVNVHKMKLCGAEVVPVTGGTGTLKDAINDALRYWTAHVEDTFYLFGTAGGPHPYPTIVKHFQAPIGREARRQCLDTLGRLPDLVCACVGGGSNAIGIFSGFVDDANVRLVGVEGAGRGLDTHQHCATLVRGTVGVLHGAQTYVLQDEDGQIHETECISAGLDYPGVGPEHAWLKDSGRAEYVSADDEAVLDVFHLFIQTEGIIPALESSHALAWLASQKGKFPPDTVAIANLSGRGDKDVNIVEERMNARKQQP